MSCKYGTQEDGKIHCNLENDVCLYVQFCALEGRYKNIGGYDYKCSTYKKEEKDTMDKNKVVLVDKGFIYVEVKDKNMTVKLKNVFGDEIPNGVDLVEIKGDYYIKGYEPKTTVKKMVVKKDIEE